MMMQRSFSSFSDKAFNRVQYSTAAAGSWMLHGPTMTRRRSSACVVMRAASRRPRITVSREVGEAGSSEARSAGGMRGSYPRTAGGGY